MSNYEATKYDFNGANLTDIEGVPTATIIPQLYLDQHILRCLQS